MSALFRLLAVLSVSVMPVLPASAQTQDVLVELYTSQGCNSCPPSDELLGELAEREGIIALALHVDYWDYIGWKDEFADPAHGLRQKRYAREAGRNVVYTPQMIISGQTSVEGTKPMELMDKIQAAKTRQAPVDLALVRRGGTLTINARAISRVTGPVSVYLVRYAPERTVSIARGENRGRTLTYHNVVTSWVTVGNWDPRRPLSVDVPLRGADETAVIVQQDGPGPVLAAAKLR
ncbi:MAG: DUF1223 domain-containing protein [Pseudomonadota bacterium]